MAASTTPATTSAEQLIISNIDVWTSAIKQKASTGRGSNKKQELYGIKKLRELILELAVRGLLVSQDPNDEPASVLLEKIAAEKEQLLNNGKIKPQKKAKVFEQSISYDSLPVGWVAADFGDITYNRDAERVPLSVSDRNLRKGKYDYYGASGVIDHIDAYLYDKPLLLIGEDGANLVNRSTPIAFMAYGKYWVNNHAHVLDGINEEFLVYLSLYINSISLLPYITGMAQPKMNQAKMNSILVLLPPEAEQPRIVAKVNELMTLCDQLEQQTESSLAAHQTLVETLLNSLLEAAKVYPGHASSAAVSGVDVKNDPFQMAWQQIWDNFDLLFTTEQSIDQLKQTILQLAVMGKLVPQDPEDEPASVLLEKIAAEKEQLIKDKKIKKQKPLPSIGEDKKSFKLPNGWEWCSLSHLGTFTGGKTPSKNNNAYWGGDIPWVTPKDMKVDFINSAEDHVTDLAIEDGLAKINKESILFVARSGILRRKFPVAITKIDCTVNQDLKVLTLVNKSLSGYVLVMMHGFESYILKNLTKIGTTVESLRFDDFSIQNFMLPPEAEQRRIVAKAKELIALCNYLKECIAESQTTQLNLTDAIAEQVI